MQSKVNLLLLQEGWLEGVKLEGKCPPCTSWSSVKRPHKEKAIQKHQLIAINSSALTQRVSAHQAMRSKHAALVAEHLHVLRRLEEHFTYSPLNCCCLAKHPLDETEALYAEQPFTEARRQNFRDLVTVRSFPLLIPISQ